MPGNSPTQAFHEFIEPVRRTVSCITRVPVIVSHGGRRRVEGISALMLADGEPVMLTAEGSGVTLSIGLQYEVIRNPDPEGKKYKVRTRGYEYTFRDFAGHDLVAYHWHPLGEDGFTDPHIHAASAKPHYPSARVSLESVVRTAITEFHADPCRDDWDEVIAINESRFVLYRTWHDATQLQKLNI